MIARVLICLACLPSLALAWIGSDIDFPSEGQGWSFATDSVKYTGPDGQPEWFRYTLTAPANDAVFQFKMTAGNSYANNWGGNLIFPKNELATIYHSPGSDAFLTGGVTAGKRYVFTTYNPSPPTSAEITVMEISNAPVAINTVSRNATTGLITITLSAAPSPEEKVYVRYTDSGWTYSQVVLANVAGSTATATIPDIKDGKNYQWYVLTSTATPDKFQKSFATDALTLAWSNTSTIIGVPRITDLTINSASGGYKTTKFFIDEIAGDSQTLNVSTTFNAGTPPSEVEVVTNLNRRDKADQDNNADGIADAILPPPRDLCGQNETHYYKAYPMTAAGSIWSASLPVTKTGAYRATVRYRFSPTGAWFYFGDRDHAVVVSPKKTLEMTLYEVNPLTIEATAANQSGRSTFVDLLGAADGDSDGNDPLSLAYFDTIQTNCLWFQPIHPTGALGVENDPATSSPYVPGSPYATKNFFAVNPALGSANTESSALAEFQNFVTKADNYAGSVGTINVMLDFVANHTAWDAIYGQGGVDLGFTGSAANAIPVNWFSRTGDYGQAATYFTNLADKDKAVAPDRNDFPSKWNDVSELYYGRYSALWRYPSYGEGFKPHKNEDDVMDWNSISPEVVKLWRMFGYYPTYWLAQTGHSLSNSATGSYAARLAADNKGIDSVRCDFGQGLPNPLWEYIINKTRSVKWNFVFMAETLDGAEPGKRSNRVFDILNEDMVFRFTLDHVNDEGILQSELETRRDYYRTGAILLNLTSHDEILPDNDAWLNATRHALLSSVPGLPMIFNGQEQGIQNYNTNPGTFHFDGFEADHELNFSKRIPHFKKWNRAQFWYSSPVDLRPPNNTGMAQWYGRVNWARLNSPAIKSINQYYLDKRPNGTTPNSNVFAIAKYEQAGASPAFKDVVICFANLFTHGAAHSVASDTFDLRGGVGDPLWPLLGIQNSAARQYNIRNLASSNASANIWTPAHTGADIYSNGVFVSLGGGTVNPITNDGELAQYLKIVDVTPPPSSAPNASYYMIGTTGTFTWTSNAGAHDNITGWTISIGTTPGGTSIANNLSLPGTATSHNFTGIAGQTYYATLTAVSGAGVNSVGAASDTSQPNPSSQTTPVILLSPTGDQDGDGQSNEAEQIAGTNPLAQTSALKITNSSKPSASSFIVTWSSVIGKKYRVQAATTPTEASFTDISGDITAVAPASSFTDTSAAGTWKFYRVRVVP